MTKINTYHHSPPSFIPLTGSALSSRAGGVPALRLLAPSGAGGSTPTPTSSRARGCFTTRAVRPSPLAVVAASGLPPQRQPTPPLSDSFIVTSYASIPASANTTNRVIHSQRFTTPTTDQHCPGLRRYASTCTTSSASSSASSSSRADSNKTNSVSGPAARRVLYGGHQPTSPLQRTAMAGWAAVTALMDPGRADMVATLGEVTGRLALERLYRSVSTAAVVVCVYIPFFIYLLCRVLLCVCRMVHRSVGIISYTRVSVFCDGGVCLRHMQRCGGSSNGSYLVTNIAITYCNVLFFSNVDKDRMCGWILCITAMYPPPGAGRLS